MGNNGFGFMFSLLTRCLRFEFPVVYTTVIRHVLFYETPRGPSWVHTVLIMGNMGSFVAKLGFPW